MKWIAIILSVLVIAETPFKPKEEFDIKLDYQFKQRPSGDRNEVKLDETRADYDRRNSTAVLPYLVLNVKVVKVQGEEARVRVTDNFDHMLTNKKIAEGTIIPVVVGFTDDAKDRVTAHEFVVSFLSADKKPCSRILIQIDQDGTFLVNGEKRGKF